MTPERLGHETESAVEALLLKKNGDRKTVQDVFEIVVAMNHDRRADAILLLSELKTNREILEKHLREDVRMSNDEFDNFIQEFRDEHKEIEKEILDIKENCNKARERQPRRATDPTTEDWGLSMNMTLEDTEMGDMRRFWRVVKWAAIVSGAAFLVAVGDELSHLLFGN